MTVARAQRQNVVWHPPCSRYFAARQLGGALAADNSAIVQSQQIHPLGADCISGLVVGIEPNGEWAGHLACFFYCYLWGAKQGPRLGEDEEKYPHDGGDNADAANGDTAPSQPVENSRSRRDPALIWLFAHALASLDIQFGQFGLYYFKRHGHIAVFDDNFLTLFGKNKLAELFH